MGERKTFLSRLLFIFFLVLQCFVLDTMESLLILWCIAKL